MERKNLEIKGNKERTDEKEKRYCKENDTEDKR